MILGGGHLKSFSSSFALGVNPSAAGGSVVLDTTTGSPVFTLGVGDYIVYSYGGIGAFYGVVTEAKETSNDPASGTVYDFSVSDNRIRLQWQTAFFAVNMEDENWTRRLGRPAAPAAPGDSNTHGSDNAGLTTGEIVTGGTITGHTEGAGDVPDPVEGGNVRRRYWSILPQHWAAGIKTWHDQPFTAREIFNIAFDGAWGDFGFSRSYHSALSDLILTNIDHTSGVKLSSLLSEINDKAGLEISISGSRSLVWHRKGEGLPPLPDAASTGLSSGLSVTANDTRIRILGERIRIQVCNVELEPDWKSGWEKFIDEVAWRREVATVWNDRFSAITNEKQRQAEISAFARQVTVWQYAKKKNDTSLLDYRPFGRVVRNHMEAWAYIQELVFRSYRIPPTRTLYGVPLSSLEMADSLICATAIDDGEGDAAKQIYATDPVELYPSVQAQVIAKGQPLDLISSRDIRLFYRNRETDLRQQWSAVTDFEVDPSCMSIRFGTPIFVDGQASEGKSLFFKVNKGEGGGNDLSATLDEQSDYLDVVVPNPACEISAASVKASFCFLFGNFFRDYGRGERRGHLRVDGLGLHLLDVKGGIGGTFTGTATYDSGDLPFLETGDSSFREVLYEDGGKAIEKASAAASSVIQISSVQSSGGFTRHGLAAASVSGVVDRVEISVSMEGLSETITFTKARPTPVPLAEKTLARLQRGAELFAGQAQLRKEVREYKLIAKALKTTGRADLATTHRKFADAFTKPVGSETVSTQILYDKNSASPTRTTATGSVKAWQAGDIVWVDGKGVPSATGSAIGGILVAKPAMVTAEGGGETQSKELVVATRGIVPVRVRGTIDGGGTVMATAGEHYGSASGSKVIGTLMHGEATPVPTGDDKEVLAMVNLGGGGAGESGICWFGEVITWEDSSSTPKTGIRGGIIEGGETQWWEPNHEIATTPDREKLLWIELEILTNTTTDGATVLSAIKQANKAGILWSEGDVSTGYPDKIVPPIFPTGGVTPGAGKIIIPIGKITTKAGAITLDRAGCGHIVITHCPGNLSYERRSDLASSSSSTSV